MNVSRCPVAAGTGRLHLSHCRCLVDADPTHTYLRSLTAAGWPLHLQNQLIGDRRGHYCRVLARSRVERGTAMRIARLWDRWWDVPGPSVRAVGFAHRQGWDAPDPVVVHRLIAGRPVTCTRLDRDQAVRVLVARGVCESAISTRLHVGITTVRRLAAGTLTGLAAATLPHKWTVWGQIAA